MQGSLADGFDHPLASQTACLATCKGKEAKSAVLRGTSCACLKSSKSALGGVTNAACDKRAVPCPGNPTQACGCGDVTDGTAEIGALVANLENIGKK